MSVSESDIAFVVGFWFGDGELAFNVSKDMKFILPQICFSNSDTGILVFVARVLEELGYIVSVAKGGANNWAVRLCTFKDVKVFSEVILSYIIECKKRRQVEIFLSKFVPIYQNRRSNKKAGGGKLWEKKTFIKAVKVIDEISSLKTGKGAKRRHTSKFFSRKV